MLPVAHAFLHIAAVHKLVGSGWRCACGSPSIAHRFPSERMRQLLHALQLMLISLPAAAQYSGPESVEYDPVGDRYFVSNT